MDGQLSPTERRTLFELVLARRPGLVLEVGTWAGGGSTLQLVNALRQLNAGILYTCETNAGEFAQACSGHQALQLEPGHFRTPDGRLELFNLPGLELLGRLAAANQCPGMTFLDGSEDQAETLAEVLALERFMDSGAVLVLHDWDLGQRVDGNFSTKCKLARPYLENNSNWQPLWVLTAPVSVGMAAFQYRGWVAG